MDIGYSAPGSREILWSLKRGQPTKATFKAALRRRGAEGI